MVNSELTGGVVRTSLLMSMREPGALRDSGE
jgi:hypothetical protein